MPRAPEEFKKITVSNELSAQSRGDLQDFETQMRSVARAMESASNSAVIFSEAMKKIDAETGKATQSFLVRPSDYPNAIAAGRARGRRVTQKIDEDGVDFFADARVQDMVMLEYQRKRKGTLAQSLLKEEIASAGGTAVKTGADRFSVRYPVPKAEYEERLAEGDARQYFSKQLDSVTRLSGRKSSEAVREENRRKKEEAEKKEAEKKSSQPVTSSTVASGFKVLRNLLSQAVNVLQRLLSFAMNRTAEYKDRSLAGAAVGLTQDRMRSFGIQERVMGMPEGTFAGALKTIQASFGNIDKLDTGKLQDIALLAGGGVRTAVQNGLGSRDPLALARQLLDAAFKKSQSGKDSLGRGVGRDAAEREIQTRLGGISPELATLFRYMTYSANHDPSFKGQIKDFNTFTRAVPDSTGGMSSLERTRLAELNTEINGVTNSFKVLGETLSGQFLLAIRGLIGSLSNGRWGMNEKESLDTDAQNRVWNRNAAEWNAGKAKEYRGLANKILGQYEAPDSTGFKNLGEYWSWYSNASTKEVGQKAKELGIKKDALMPKSMLSGVNAESAQLAVTLTDMAYIAETNAKNATAKANSIHGRVNKDTSLTSEADIILKAKKNASGAFSDTKGIFSLTGQRIIAELLGNLGAGKGTSLSFLDLIENPAYSKQVNLEGLSSKADSYLKKNGVSKSDRKRKKGESYSAYLQRMMKDGRIDEQTLYNLASGMEAGFLVNPDEASDITSSAYANANETYSMLEAGAKQSDSAKLDANLMSYLGAQEAFLSGAIQELSKTNEILGATVQKGNNLNTLRVEFTIKDPEGKVTKHTQTVNYSGAGNMAEVINLNGGLFRSPSTDYLSSQNNSAR